MGRSPCCDESGLKKGPWTPEEDQKLVKHIQKHGHGSWRALPKLAGLNRCGKSCRLRWTNYLRPDIKRGKFSQDEEQTILNLHSILGNKWSAIASHLPGRTDNEIKNFWNTHLKKKLIQMGFDPMTHRPRTDIFSSLPHLIALANLKDLIDNTQSWEAQMARLQYLQYLLQTPATSIATNNINTTNPFADMDTLSLLSSIKETPLVLNNSNSSLNINIDSIPFSHLPDLQVPNSFENPILNKNHQMVQDQNQVHDHHHHQLIGFGQGENSPNSNSTSVWMASVSCGTPPNSVAAQGVTALEANLGDACSASSYGGAADSVWPELLLEDPLFHEIA